MKINWLTIRGAVALLLFFAIGQMENNRAFGSEGMAASGATSGSLSAEGEGLKHEPTPEEIFQSVFGRKMEALPAASYPVILDDLNIGDIQARPSEPVSETELDAKELKQLLLPYLVETRLLELNKLLSRRQYISMSELSVLGIGMVFNTSAQSIDLSIPFEMRSEFPVAIYRRNDPTIGVDYLTESDFSAIANVYGSANVVHRSEYLDVNDVNENLSVETAIRWNDVVFESGVNYASGSKEKLTYRNTRFVKDLVEERIRLQAGDVEVANRALQSDLDMFGFSMSRYFGTKPYTSIRPNPSRSFTIKGDARVSIYVNERLAKETRLSAGRYTLQDLPLRNSSGNDIRLVVNYDSGETEQLVFDAFYDFYLLLKGTSEFATSVGLRNLIVNGKREYDRDRPVLSAFYRKGVSDTFSLGVNAQAENDYMNIGVEGLLASGIGSFGVFTNVSRTEVDSGSALSVFYRVNHFIDDGVITLNLQNDIFDKRYRTIAGLYEQPDYSNHVTGRLVFDHSTGFSLSTTYENKAPIQGGQDETSLSASLTYNTRYGSVSLSGRSDDSAKGRSSFWGITFSTAFDSGSASFAYQSRDPYTRVGFANPPQAGAYSFGYDVAHSIRAEHDQSRLGLSYSGNRFDSRLELNVADGETSQQYGDEANSLLFFSTALVHADGQSAFSRPVSDSFVIFPANKGAENFRLGVDSQSSFWTDNNRYHAWSDAMGPPVINNLNSYYLRRITVDAPFAPAGTSIGSQAYSIVPGYRGGLSIGVGSDENVALVGSLVDENNQVVPFAVGHTLGKDGEKHNFFSNAGGRFYVGSQRAGSSVQLMFTHPVNTTVNISIPDDTVGMFRLERPIALPYLVGSER